MLGKIRKAIAVTCAQVHGEARGRHEPFGRRSQVLILVLAAVVAFSVLGCAGGEEATTASNSGNGSDAGADARKDASKDAEYDAGEGGSEGCVPKTCAQIDANCGTAPDGCGGVIECGDCPPGQNCGGGGTNVCGPDECTPKSCVQVDAQCGWASDGCSEAMDCGTCVAPETCGGGGMVNKCGCRAKTCGQLGANCGTLPDGCTGTLNCGECTGGTVCGGGGPNVCGSGDCVAKTCAQLGAACGTTSDGCAKALDCGECDAPDVCGGGGEANQCGCTPKTCEQMGANCGMVDTGCGPEDCGSCTPPDTCGGGGIPNQCGCTCTLPNATTSCSQGVCTIVACNAGYGDCDGDPSNGCEANLGADPNNCGQCGLVCAGNNGGAVCISGGCVITCDAGFGNCDGDPSNGCEAEFASDPDNCGACGDACSSNHVPVPECQGGVCSGQCEGGYADCNDDLRTDGCETETDTNAANCGGCGNMCSDNHVPAPTCNGGVCDGACEADYADCDGDMLGNGCEVDTMNDLDHCGSCATDCDSPAPANTDALACNAGTCEITACASGYYDQDQMYDSGCECAGDGVTNTCNGNVNLGTIGLSTITKPSSSTYYTIVPTGDRDWFRGTFQATANTCTQRPRITLVDASGQLRMRIYDTQTCTPGGNDGYACTEGGDSADASGYQSFDLGHSTSCNTSNGSIRPTDNGYIQQRSFLIEVFGESASSTCLEYQLRFSRH